LAVAAHVNRVELDYPLGDRVAVFGHGGKSTLAAAIARRTGARHIDLDDVRLLPDWVERPDEEVMDDVREMMSANPRGWVTDHQYLPATEIIMEAADSVVVLALPCRTMFWRRFKRSMKRSWTGERIIGGNRETFRQNFASRDSAVLDMWQKRKRYRRFEETISGYSRPGVDFFVVRFASELDLFYELQGLSRDG
jgi:adenylate kinase family enzyme